MADISKSVPAVIEALVLGGKITGATLYADVAVDFPSMNTLTIGVVDVTVTGVTIGDIVLDVVSATDAALSAAVYIFGSRVIAANTVRVFAHNSTAGTLDAASHLHDFVVLERTSL